MLADAARGVRVRTTKRFTAMPGAGDALELQSLTQGVAVTETRVGLTARIVELANGLRSPEELVRAATGFPAEAVRAGIEQLRRAGVVELVDDGALRAFAPGELERLNPQISFLSHFVAPPETRTVEAWPGTARSGLDFQERLRSASVAVFGLGRSGSQLVRLLALAGVGRLVGVDSEIVGDRDIGCDAWFDVRHRAMDRAAAVDALVKELGCASTVVTGDASDDEALREILRGCDLAVLCPDHWKPSLAAEVNRAALATGTTWTSAQLAGFEFQIGPTVVPRKSACRTCWELRRRSNLADLADHDRIEEFLESGRLRVEALAFTPGVGLLALEVVKAVTWFATPATCSHVYCLNLVTLQSQLRPVLKVPRCPDCGRVAQGSPRINVWQQSDVDATAVGS